MVIDNATLLQVDTTAIVGIFIFLTLQRFGQKEFNIGQGVSIRQPESMLIITSILVIPFAFSAMAILVGETYPNNPTVKYIVQQGLGISRNSAIIGFGYILFVFVYVLVWKKTIMFRYRKNNPSNHHD